MRKYGKHEKRRFTYCTVHFFRQQTGVGFRVKGGTTPQALFIHPAGIKTHAELNNNNNNNNNNREAPKVGAIVLNEELIGICQL